MGKRPFFLLSLVWLLVLVVPLTDAAVVQKLSIEDMTEQAGFILEGKVLSSRCEWNAGRNQIYTFVDIEVKDLQKGTYPSGILHLRILGGKMGDIGMYIPGSPRFTPGKDLVLFLGANPQSLFPVIGFSQGCFEVSRDQKTGREMTINSLGISVSKTELKNRIDRALAK